MKRLVKNEDKFQRIDEPSEEIDILLYGNAYTTRDGHRLDPINVRVVIAPSIPFGVQKVIGFEYRINDKESFIFDAHEISHKRSDKTVAHFGKSPIESVLNEFFENKTNEKK